MRKILASLFALVLLLGACTDDDSSSDDEETTETDSTDASDEGQDGGSDEGSEDEGDSDDEGSEDEGSEDEVDPDDQARVDAALDAVAAQATADGFNVTLEDAVDDEDDELQFESDECQEADRVFNDLDDEIGETAASQALDAQRGDFVAEDSVVEQVSLEISSTPSTDDVALGFDALESIDVAGCIVEAFEVSAEEDGVTAENVTADVSTAGRGDRDIVISITADFSSQGVTFPVDIVFTLIAVDRDVIFASALTFNSSAADDTLGLFDLAVDELG